MRGILTIILLFGFSIANATEKGDYLVKLQGNFKTSLARLQSTLPAGTKVEALGLGNWVQVRVPKTHLQSVPLNALQNNGVVEAAQPNYTLRALENPSLHQLRQKMAEVALNNDDDCPVPIPGFCDDNGNGGGGGMPGQPPADNPAIPGVVNPGTGSDPLLNSQWGMLDIGAQQAWKKSIGRKDVVVAVIDTGVDYTHEDIKANLWRNPHEIPGNGVDDDNNGYVDDVIGWDFVSDDNKPFDLAVSQFELFQGGNPGHGTHCAGNVAARGSNGKGVSGVAPNVSIMSIRFLSEKGQGTTAGAVKSIIYAVKNGAHILSNSWGSEGENPNDPSGNQALKDAIQVAQDEGRLFVAAAGNGHQGVGYDNDSDAKPAYPASYPHDIIVSVAAIDDKDALGAFSNWGRNTVDIGAPGVKVFSTTVGSQYSDTVFDMFGMVITWDGTSMATPHVAGAAALYLSHNPGASWRDIKNALLQSATPISALNGKSVSNGKLNVQKLLEL